MKQEEHDRMVIAVAMTIRESDVVEGRRDNRPSFPSAVGRWRAVFLVGH